MTGHNLQGEAGQRSLEVFPGQLLCQPCLSWGLRTTPSPSLPTVSPGAAGWPISVSGLLD